MKMLVADLRQWLVPIMRERCLHEQNWHLPKRRTRLWLTVKAIVCIVLRLDADRGRGWPKPQIVLGYTDDGVEVAHANGSTWTSMEYVGPCGSIDYLMVARRGWWFREGYASWP